MAVWCPCARSGCGNRAELTQAECLAFRNSQSSPTVINGVSHEWGADQNFLSTASHYPPGCWFYWAGGGDRNRILFSIPGTVNPLRSSLGTSEHAIPICACIDLKPALQRLHGWRIEH